MPKLELKKRYPISEYYDFGYLNVDKNISIYYELRGNPDGFPVVCNHGGPGGSSQPEYSQFFNPELYNIILYDQRGTGKSNPSVEDDFTDPEQFIDTSPDDFVSDLEKLRLHLNIEKWLVVGGSWGSTLSIYYAQKHPEPVAGLIFWGTFLNSSEEWNRYYKLSSVEKDFPEIGHQAFSVLLDYAYEQGFDVDPEDPEQTISVYRRLCVEQNDSTAQYLWTAYERFNSDPTEESLNSLYDIPEVIDPSDKAHAVFESIISKYAYQGGFNLLDPLLLEQIKNIKIRIFQGLSDTLTPPKFVKKLKDALLSVEADHLIFRLVEGRHSVLSSEEMIDALITFTDLFLKTCSPNITKHGLFSSALNDIPEVTENTRTCHDL